MQCPNGPHAHHPPTTRRLIPIHHQPHTPHMLHITYCTSNTTPQIIPHCNTPYFGRYAGALVQHASILRQHTTTLLLTSCLRSCASSRRVHFVGTGRHGGRTKEHKHDWLCATRTWSEEDGTPSTTVLVVVVGRLFETGFVVECVDHACGIHICMVPHVRKSSS